MLFDTDAGAGVSFDLGDAKTSIRTPGTAGSFYIAMMPNPTNNIKWTFSCWLKRGALGVDTSVFGADSSTYTWSVTAGDIGFNTSNQLYFSTSDDYWSFVTNRVFVDTSAWMYLQVNFDSAAASSTDRIKIYINGVRELDFDTATYPTIRRASTINKVDVCHQLGFSGDTYLSNVCFIDGQSLEPTSFGFKSTVCNEWQSLPQSNLASLCSSYGTSSFFFDFKDGSTSAALGYDTSTHNNNWTVPSYVLSGPTTNWYREGPGNPYPVLGSSDPALTSTLSMGNLRYTGLASQDQQRRTQKAIRGKVYFEVTRVSGTSGAYISLARPGLSGYPGQTTGSYGWQLANGYIYRNASVVSSRSLTSAVGDTLMFAVDIATERVWQGVNGTWYGGYVPPSASGAVSLPYLSDSADWFLGVGSSAACVLDCNFGQRPFAYSPPPGFNSQCNLNDPELEITNPSLHFDVLVEAGATIKNSADALYGGNCIELIKDRSNIDSWNFLDTARGLSIASPFPAADWGETGYVAKAGASVAYVWNTGTPAASNTSGTVTVTSSGNTEAGISAVAYPTGMNGTIGHGAGRSPNLVIAKMRTSGATYPWAMWSLPDPIWFGKNLNTLAGPVSARADWDTPTASVLSRSSSNCDSNVYTGVSQGVAYCFSDIAGFAKLAQRYVGNASANGPFVYLGFKPKLVIIKHNTVTSGHWVFIDSVRSPGNYVNDALYTDSTGAEVVTTNTTGAYIQFLSTGFKVCSSHVDVNASGITYNVMAFADVPETYALAR